MVRPSQCAVFLKDRITSSPVAPDGRPFHRSDSATCTVFDSLDDARRFCEAKVQALPQVRLHPNDLTTYLVFTGILAGMRFLFWDSGRKHREKQRQETAR